VDFTLEELKGVPEDVVSGYTQRKEGEATFCEVTFKTPDIFPLVRFTGSCGYQRLTLELSILKFKFAENPDTRRRARQEYENRLSTNLPLISKILDTRHQIAEVLGYSNWADYQTEVLMVKDVASLRTVLACLESVSISTDMPASSSTTCRNNSAQLA
jgi:Zn-dependent oligopeptidase